MENKLGGYRPWSIDTSYKRPGEYSWTSSLIIFNVIMYGLQMVNPNVTRMFAKRADMIMSGKQLYRLFTPMFLHGSVSHLMLNSFSLSNIGPEVERLFGSGRFLATYSNPIVQNVICSLTWIFWNLNDIDLMMDCQVWTEKERYLQVEICKNIFIGLPYYWTKIFFR